jgi:hypothetical protein
MPKSVAEPILNPNMAQTISQINRPVLDQVEPPVSTNNGVLAGGFNADGVAIGTNMEADVGPTKGFVPVIVGSGMSMGVVMLNPITGAVMPKEGNDVSNLFAMNPNIQKIAMEAYNKRQNAPVVAAQDRLKTAQGMINATDGQVTGPILEQYTDAKRNLTEAQRRAMSNMSNPTAVDMASNRPKYETPERTGLEEFEDENDPYVRPTVVNNPNVANVDFADPTMAPTDAFSPSSVINFERGRGNIYDRNPVLIDTNKPDLPFNTYSENGVLTDNSAPNTVTNSGVLGTGTSSRTSGGKSGGPSVRSIMSSSGMKTSNRRGSDIPSMLVDRNEALIRIGGAMYGGALQGNGITAATQEYGSIQDANRKAEAARFKIEEARRLAAAKAAAKGRGGKGKKGDGPTAGELRFGIAKLNTALNLIQTSDGSLTGWNPSAIFSKFIGKTIGNEEEAQRLFLNEIGLDQIMKRVSETKGAISNAEMALFGRQVPQLGSQEIVWERWLQRQIQMSQILLDRLENGGSVEPNAPLSQTMPSISGGNGATTSGDFTIVEKTE